MKEMSDQELLDRIAKVQHEIASKDNLQMAIKIAMNSLD